MTGRLAEMGVFPRVADAGSFAAAARKLGLSAQMVGKRVAAIEQRLGARLIHRSTRHQSVIEAGHSFREGFRRTLAELDAADADVAAQATRPRGLWRVTAPVAFGTPGFVPDATRLLAGNPELRIKSLSQNSRRRIGAGERTMGDREFCEEALAVRELDRTNAPVLRSAFVLIGDDHGMPQPSCLSAYPYVVVRVACWHCPHRSGSYRLARLAAKYGPETPLDVVLKRIAFDCAYQFEPAPGQRSVSHYVPKCRVHFPDLERPNPPPPDVPPAMIALRVIKGGKA